MTTAPLLALEAATYEGSVAIVRPGEVLAERTVAMRGSGVERLLPAVEAALSESGVQASELGGVVCGEGPGSFTSLRIAGAIAKGIASAHSLPLHAVSSLLLILAGSRWSGEAGRYLALLGAMRGELFAAGYELSSNGNITEIDAPPLVSEDEVERLAHRLGARRIGVGQELAAAPHARGVSRLMAAEIVGAPVELDGWEPRYGRVAEAQARWEASHGRPLPAG